MDVVAYAHMSGFLGTPEAGAEGSFQLRNLGPDWANSKTDLLRGLVEGREDREEQRKRTFRY